MVETFFTLEEVAGILKVHENTVRKLLKNREIRGVKVGREWRITRSAINTFAREGERDYREEEHFLGKYAPLARYLSGKEQEIIVLTFEKIEEILKSSLPLSARKHNAWWHEEKFPRAHKIAWSQAGYRVSEYSIKDERVVFQKKWTEEEFMQEIRSVKNQCLEDQVCFFFRQAQKWKLDLCWGESEGLRTVFARSKIGGKDQMLFCLDTNGIMEVCLTLLREVVPPGSEDMVDELLERLRIPGVAMFMNQKREYCQLDFAVDMDVLIIEKLVEAFRWVFDRSRAGSV